VQTNIPEIVAEVRAEFERYERALNANDVATCSTRASGMTRS
jgi:hypothetical protein